MYDGKLSAEDLRTITHVRDRWMQIALSTERCDRPRAEAAVKAAYTAAGLPEPELVVWMDSPLGGALASATIKHLATKRGQLWDQLSPWWDAYWLALYTTALPLADLSNARLTALVEAQEQVGWWWPMQGAVVLTERPTIIERDAQGQLHCETGPALAYADGYAMNSWHGVRCPDDFHTWDTARALAEKNSEIRRCAIERLGWDAVTDRMTLIAEADDPGNTPNTIRLYDLPADMADLYEEPARILVVANASLDKGGHRRGFGLPVPAHHDDPIAAAADLFGVPVQAYRALARAS